jgi:TonB family protein
VSAYRPSGHRGTVSRRDRRTLIRGTCLLSACACAAGCVDTVNPSRTGLRLGLEEGPLRPPAAEEPNVFEFPRSAWEKGIGGTTVLKILIAADGTIDSAIVLESSGYRPLDSAAVANAGKLRYRPAEQGGEAVPIWGRLPVIYPLPEEGEADGPSRP